MFKSLVFNPHIGTRSTLAEIEAELEFLIKYAEEVLDWDITEEETRRLTLLTRLAKSMGSTRKW